MPRSAAFAAAAALLVPFGMADPVVAQALPDSEVDTMCYVDWADRTGEFMTQFDGFWQATVLEAVYYFALTGMPPHKFEREIGAGHTLPITADVDGSGSGALVIDAGQPVRATAALVTPDIAATNARPQDSGVPEFFNENIVELFDRGACGLSQDILVFDGTFEEMPTSDMQVTTRVMLVPLDATSGMLFWQQRVIVTHPSETTNWLQVVYIVKR